MTVHIEPPHREIAKGKTLLSGNLCPKSGASDPPIVRPRVRPVAGNSVMEPAQSLASHTSDGRSANQSSSGTRSAVSSTTPEQKPPSHSRSASGSRTVSAETDTRQLPAKYTSVSPFQRNIRAPVRSQHGANMPDGRVKQQADLLKNTTANEFSAKYRGSLKQNNGDKKLIHNPIVHRSPPSPRSNVSHVNSVNKQASGLPTQ